jgi:hypothetical protein
MRRSESLYLRKIIYLVHCAMPAMLPANVKVPIQNRPNAKHKTQLGIACENVEWSIGENR